MAYKDAAVKHYVPITRNCRKYKKKKSVLKDFFKLSDVEMDFKIIKLIVETFGGNGSTIYLGLRCFWEMQPRSTLK